MADQKIEPHRITKPIQLLGAWLVGLILTDSIFLTATLSLAPQSWERGALVIAAIVNVPLFLSALFLLQTKFRPELQEDTYYHEYISKKSATILKIDKNTAQDNRLSELERKIYQITELKLSQNPQENENFETHELDWQNWNVSINCLHPNYKKIKESLNLSGIPIASTIGNRVTKAIPEAWTISLNPIMPVSHKSQLLRTVLPFGFDGIELYYPLPEAGETEDVYIGGYGVGNYSKITPELFKLLESEISDAELSTYCANNNFTL
ncbi:hypothetical protein K4754_06880 [Pseudomonas glycinae]|uniref:hypothetical protein n=1 Tax=Pseudomonas glycinae TaxID=1785145 RepID=UPI001C89588B|nr:hypothetical protein [Pseudomonas glycinae]MBX8621750.1 hypothetical protein [Pseudomonas glycinae]